MKYIGVALVYLGFFSLIGAAIYWTSSAWPLFALLLTPNVKIKED